MRRSFLFALSPRAIANDLRVTHKIHFAARRPKISFELEFVRRCRDRLLPTAHSQVPTKIMKFHLAALTALASSAALSAVAAEPKLVLKARNYFSYGYENGATEGLPNGKQYRFGFAGALLFVRGSSIRIESNRIILVLSNCAIHVKADCSNAHCFAYFYNLCIGYMYRFHFFYFRIFRYFARFQI